MEIRKLREEKLLTQAQLAKLLRVHKNQVSRWERGEQKPSFKTLKKLCKVFGITASQ